MPVLTVIKGRHRGAELVLEEAKPYRLGRSRQCEIILEDPGISKIHCVLEPHAGSWGVRDLGSRNGTSVNGEKAMEKVLSPGDEIGVGESVLSFRLDPIREAHDAATEAADSLPPTETFERMPPGDRQTLPKQADGRDPLIGQDFGAYRVVASIGTGGMGRVYRATHRATGKLAALKVIRDELTSDIKAVRRFIRSTKVALTLDHPNLVKVYDTGCVNGLYYFAMELIDGENLGSLLDQSRRGEGIDPRQALDVIAQIAHALAYAQENGVVHRDVKPDNILLGTDGVARLADVCLVKTLADAGLTTSITHTLMSIGTMEYMPPEQMFDAKHVDHRADLYSLGATLYHMLSGAEPFPGKRTKEKAADILAGNVVPLASVAPHLPEMLCHVVGKAMAVEAWQRYQSAQDMLKDLIRARDEL